MLIYMFNAYVAICLPFDNFVYSYFKKGSRCYLYVPRILVCVYGTWSKGFIPRK